MVRIYRFSNVELRLELPEELRFEKERTLSPFAVDAVTQPHRFTFRLTQTLTPPGGPGIAADSGFVVYREGEGTVRYIGNVSRSWQDAYIRASHRGREHEIELRADQFRGRIGTHTILTALGAEHLLARAGGFVFHCAYIEHDGRAILFTAPSGTGKSTQAELWKTLRGARIINGDRAAVSVRESAATAHGIPFSGSSEYCENRSLPIAGIIYLSQAPSTAIRRLRPVEAFARIWEGVSVNTWDREDVALVSEAVKRVAERVPMYHLACTPDLTAVEAVERVLK